MKTLHKFGYLFALLSVGALFACNQTEEDDNTVVNDSPFVGTWNVTDWKIQSTVEMLDSMGNVIRTFDPTVTSSNTQNDKIDFKADYTALRTYDAETGPRLDAFKWNDLGEDLVLYSFQTYEKTAIDTFSVKHAGSTVTLNTMRKNKTRVEIEEEFNDTVNDTIFMVSKFYDGNIYHDITITLDK